MQIIVWSHNVCNWSLDSRAGAENSIMKFCDCFRDTPVAIGVSKNDCAKYLGLGVKMYSLVIIHGHVLNGMHMCTYTGLVGNT